MFATENQFDLVHLNALLFLQGLLDGQDLVFRLKVKGLLAARQGFDKDLCFVCVKGECVYKRERERQT